MNTRLFIQNREIELDETVQFAITKQFEDLSNPTTIINDWSKTVSIPFTARNNEIFGHIYNPDKLTVEGGSNQALTGIYFNPYKKLDMRLQWGDDVLMVGYAKMNEVKQANGKGTYEITLFGELGKVFQEMQKITFDTTTDDTDYLIDGSKYVDEYITKELVSASWNSTGQTKSNLQEKWIYAIDSQTGMVKKQHNLLYKVTDIIGFAPNNSFNSNFDYKSYETSDGVITKFTDTLGDTFFKDTNVDADSVIPNGMLPREIGEYRSYLQLPYIYWNKLFQIFQAKAEEVTGYKFELDSEWFNDGNPYWYSLVYMLKQFNSDTNTDNKTNIYSIQDIGVNFALGSYGKIETEDISCRVVVREEEEGVLVQHNVTPAVYNIKPKETYVINYSIPMSIHSEVEYYQKHICNAELYFDLILTVKLVDTKNNNVFASRKYCIYNSERDSNIKNVEPDIVYYYGVPKIKGKEVTGGYYNFNFTVTDSIRITDYYAKQFKFQYECKFRRWNGDVPLEKPNGDVPLETPIFLNYGEAAKFSKKGITVWQTGLADYTFTIAKNDIRSFSEFTLSNLWDNKYNLFQEVMNYCKIYRIGIYVDYVHKKIIFKPLVKIFSDYTINDWTNKVDKNKDYIIKPITFENKYILFNYSDNNSRLAKKYKENYGVNYGEYRLSTDYNFNNETKKLFGEIKQSIISSDNVLSWTTLYNKHKIIYTVTSEEYIENKDEDYKNVEVFGAMFFHNGLRSFDSDSDLRSVYISDDTTNQSYIGTYCYYQNSAENNVVTTYPNIQTTNGNNVCLFNLPSEYYTIEDKFSGKNSIYKNFWENYLNERYNIQNKIITCYVMLTPTEYNQFQWNKFVKIGNQLCIVNKIYDYDMTSNQSTKVDLITIQDINGYTKNNYNA